MIAEIYLIKRLPRQMAFFDYQIPDDMKLGRGALVHVPFRNQVVRGIVAGIKNESEHQNIKPISELINPEFLSDAELAVYETVAEKIVQSVPAVLDAAFLPPRKRASSITRSEPVSITNKIREQEVDHIKSAIELLSSGEHHFIQSTDIVQSTAIIEAWLRSTCNLKHETCNTQTLILVSHVHDADMIAAALSGIDPTMTILDSRATKPQRADIAEAWHKGETKTLITTRIGSILPAHDLGSIFVVRSGSDEHAQYDRNPRYDARDFAWRWHQATGATLAFFDVIPRVTDLHRLNMQHVTCNMQHAPDTTVLDLKEERQKTDTPILSEPLLEAMSMALQNKQKVILSYNLKESQELGLMLAERFPEARIARVSKDGGSIKKSIDQADIILATQYYFENIFDPFRDRNIGLVAELNVDLGLREPFYTATENVLIRILELHGIAWRQQCPLIMQTYSCQLIKQMLSDPWAILKAEDDVRKQFAYPPHGRIWRVFSRGTDKLQFVKEKIESTIPKAKMTLSNQILDIRSELKNTDKINNILKTLPDSYIIEIDPERVRKL